MKLYTEEQVKEAIEIAQKCDHDCGGVYFDYGTTDGILQQLTPIELPSNEEVMQEIQFDLTPTDITFLAGINWMRDKILGGANESN
jgi:hypothetical protein